MNTQRINIRKILKNLIIFLFCTLLTFVIKMLIFIFTDNGEIKLLLFAWLVDDWMLSINLILLNTFLNWCFDEKVIETRLKNPRYYLKIALLITLFICIIWTFASIIFFDISLGLQKTTINIKTIIYLVSLTLISTFIDLIYKEILQDGEVE